MKDLNLLRLFVRYVVADTFAFRTGVGGVVCSGGVCERGLFPGCVAWECVA